MTPSAEGYDPDEGDDEDEEENIEKVGFMAIEKNAAAEKTGRNRVLLCCTETQHLIRLLTSLFFMIRP